MNAIKKRILNEISDFEECYGTRPTATELKCRLNLKQDDVKQAMQELFADGILWSYDSDSRAYRIIKGGE
jgi:DNA-directed RNA polymerase specialized sigma subunit